MKFTFTLLLPFFINYSFSQDLSYYDSLSKYTYLLVGMKKVDSLLYSYPLGSCFFIRAEKRLFFITAKHCINDFNTFNLQTTGADFDSVGVRFYNKKNNTYENNTLDTKNFKKVLPNNYFYQDADVFVIPIIDTIMEPNINSIEKFLFDSVNLYDILDSVIAVGYGVKDKSTFSNTTPPIYYEGILANSSHIDKYYPINDSLYYVTRPASFNGMSGSPVFFKYHSVIDYTNKLKFGGVLFGSNVPWNSAYIVNPKCIKYLMDLFHRM